MGASLATAVVLIAGCSSPLPAVTDPGPAATPAAIPESALPHPSPTPVPQPLTASDRGLTVDVHLSATTVEPGGVVTVDVTIRNERSVPVSLSRGFCDGKAIVSAQLPLPQEPFGRAWDGQAGDFKVFALAQGLANGGMFASIQGLPDRPGVTPFFCPPSSERGSINLAPGDSIKTTLTLTAELAPGVPAPPGDMPFTVLVLHDPGPMPTRPCPCPRPVDQQLTVSGVITIAGNGPHLLSTGEVIDALLSDGRFTTWLGGQPSSTWSGANVVLQNIGGAQGIVPAGASWEVDLFREIGVPRNWAIGFVDPFSGAVLNLAFCNIPCAR